MPLLLPHRSSFYAIAAWELDNVLLCTDERHWRTAMNDAQLWHGDLLSLVGRPYEAGRVQLELRYIRDPALHPGRMCIQLVAKVRAESEAEAMLLSRELTDDLETYLLPVSNGPEMPYQWRRIADHAQLLVLMDTRDDLLRRMYLNDTHIYEASGGRQIYLPPMLPDTRHAAGWGAIQHHRINSALFQSMMHEEEYVEVRLQLMPWDMPEDVESILQLVVVDALSPRQKHHSAWLKTSIENYLRHKDRLYLTLVEMYRTSAGVDNALNAAICDAFLYGHANADISGGYHSDEFMLLTDKLTDDRITGQLATVWSALFNWCLPAPVGRETNVLPCMSRAMRLEPEYVAGSGPCLGARHVQGRHTIIRAGEEALMRHLYIMGQTGTGKTTMLKSMIMDRIHNGDGMAILDPHGDLYDSVVHSIPAHRRGDVVCFNPLDREHLPAFNPLIYDHERYPMQRSVIIDDLIRSFEDRWDMRVAGGPMFEQMFSIVLSLNMDPGVCASMGTATLSRFCSIFFDEILRTRMLLACSDEDIVQYIQNAEHMTGEQSWVNWGTYITSKVNKLIRDDVFRDIINADRTLDIRALMDAGKILLINLEKGTVGSDNVMYFGRMLLSAIFRHALSRADMPPAKRRPFYVFIDEFQNFSTGDIGMAMSEVRKYRVSLILANQTLGQLSDHIVHSLLGNVGSQVFFRPGPLDYLRILPFTGRFFSEAEVLGLPNFYAIARLLHQNKPMMPFVFETLPDGKSIDPQRNSSVSTPKMETQNV